MRVLVYEAFAHVRPIGLGFVEGFTEAGHEALAIPASAGRLSQFTALGADLIVAIAPFTRSEDLAAHAGTPVALVHSAEKAHPLCRSVKACFAMGRTTAMEEASCAPLAFGSSLNVPAVPRIWDLVFIGTWGKIAHGSRGQDRIKQCAVGRRRLLVGGDIPALTQVPARLLGWLYAASRTGVNPLYADQLARCEVNERVYDLARCGVCQITNSQAAHDALDGNVLLGPVEEFPAMVDRALADHEMRERLAKTSQALAMDRHRWSDRARQILARIF